MRKLLISGIAAIAMSSGAMAGEAVKLTPSQMDRVAAGACNFFAACVQSNVTGQTAVGAGVGGCNGLLNCNIGLASGNGVGLGANSNFTAQSIAF